MMLLSREEKETVEFQAFLYSRNAMPFFIVTHPNEDHIIIGAPHMPNAWTYSDANRDIVFNSTIEYGASMQITQMIGFSTVAHTSCPSQSEEWTDEEFDSTVEQYAQQIHVMSLKARDERKAGRTRPFP